MWGGDLRVPFQPDKIVSTPRGRLYHPSPIGARALLRSTVGLQLMDCFDINDRGEQVLRWQSGRYPVQVVDE